MAEEVVFRDVMKAVYDYAATADDELAMKEDQLLYLLGNLDDDWAKVQVHVPLDALSEAEPAAGLVPSAYIEPAPPLYRAVALYDYEPNGEGEILMKENEKLSVYLKEDEWILVKIDRKGTVSQPAIGYVPANYIEEGEGDEEAAQEVPVPKAAVPIPPTPGTPTAQADNAEKAAAAAARLKGDPVDIWNVSEIDKKGKKKKGTLGVGNGSIFFASEADKAPVQKWQVSMVTSVYVNEDKHKHVNVEINTANGEISLEFGAGSRDEANAIVDKVDRSKRLAVGESSPPPKSPEPAVNTSAVTIKSPTPSAANGGLSVPPPAHPGLSPSPSGRSKGVHWDTAPPAEIPQAVQSDEESEDHTTAAAAAAPPKPNAGVIVAIAMYDFEADGDDELTVKEGDKLTVLDKEESEEWWKCRNSRGKMGVVPASYLEIESAEEAEDSAAAEAAAEAARAEAARKEQEKAAAAAAKAKRLADESRRKREQEAREAQERQEREEAEEREAEAQRQREAKEARRREAEAQAQASSKSSANGTPKNSHNRGQSKDLPGRPNLEKPKPTNTRIWHDRSGQFKVEAQFLGIHKNKIRLHKANGVIIEVPEEKMSATDMEFIRKLKENPTSPTSPSGEDDVPLGTLANRRSTQGPPSSSRPTAPLQRKSHVDWFEFFLNAGCDIDDCTRYATTFEREKFDEAILPDVKPETLRGLNLREGDIIRVMKQIEQRGWKAASPRSADPKVQEQMKKDAELAARLQEEEYGRKTPARSSTASPGLFAGPGGALRNNTRRGRPAPTKAATLTVDASGIATASEQLSRTTTPANASSPTTSAGPSGSKPATSPPPVDGFGDSFADPWLPRPTSEANKPAPTPKVATPTAATLTPAPAPAPVATPTPPPPPPAPPVQPAVAPQPVATPAAQTPAAQPTAAPKLATEFDVLARIGSMRPPSAPAQPASAPLPPTISPPPMGFQQGMGMGSSPAPMGSLLQAQATGAFSPLQAAGGPRAPFAPVPQNEGLLKPLIPTTTGFNSFVPTRPGTAPASSLGANPSFLTSQPTGYNPSFNQPLQPSISPLLANPTGYAPSASPFQNPPSATSSGFSTSSYLSANSTFQSPIVAQPTGFGNVGGGSGFGTQFGAPNPGSSFLNAVSSQPTGMYGAPPNVNPPPDNNSPANVFAAMKAGSFANAAAPQSSDKYDALRPQPTGWNALSAGVQPQPTGFNPGFGANLQPGANFGQQPGFQQPMQTGFGQPGFGAPPNQFGGYQR